MNIFFHEIKSNMKALSFWSLGMVLLTGVGIGKFTAMEGATGQSANEMMAAMPKSLQVILGFDGLDLSTITGFYGVLFLYIILTAAVHAASLGAGMISKEERDRTFEFLYVKPVTRSSIFTQKAFAVFINLVILNIVTLVISLAVIGQVSQDDISNVIYKLMIGMFIVQLIFAAIGFAVSVVLKKSKAATGLTSLVVLVTFLLSVFSDLNEKLDFLKFLTPFKYFGAKTVLNSGLDGVYVAISAAVIIIAVSCAWVLHDRRDLTV